MGGLRSALMPQRSKRKCSKACSASADVEEYCYQSNSLRSTAAVSNYRDASGEAVSGGDEVDGLFHQVVKGATI